jgi:hypothetical protein
MRFRGDVRTVTVPGCVDGWLALHEEHGRLPLARVLEAAIGYAGSGFPVSPLLAAGLPAVAGVPGSEELVGERLPDAGAVHRRPRVAAARTDMASGGRHVWYEALSTPGVGQPVRLAATAWSDPGLVFTTGVGTAVEPRNVNRAWATLCEKAGVRPVRVTTCGTRRPVFCWRGGWT